MMKKIFTLLTILLMLAVAATLTACNFENNNTPTKYNFGDTATLNDLEYTVQDSTTYTILSTPDMLTNSTHSESGAKWVAVTIKAKNTKTYSSSVIASDFKLVASDTKYSVDTDSFTWYINGNGADSIAGKEKMCYMNSSVSIDSTFSKVIVMYFKVPDDIDLSDAFLNITWAFNGVNMLIA